MLNFQKARILAMASLVLSAAPAWAGGGADLILHSGKVYTGDDKAPWAEAIAIRDGEIIAVGKDKKVLKKAGDDTRQVDLGGRMAMAGINDAHSHPLSGTVKALFECNFPFSSGPDEIAAKVAECVEQAGDEEIVVGGQWDSNFFVNHDIGSPRKFLDRVSGDKIVGLSDDSGHNAWLNTKALAFVGIDADTPDPAGGRIWREDDGRTPNGLLEETAAAIADPHLMQRPPEQLAEAIAEMQGMLNSMGFTGVKIANTPDPHLEALRAADQNEELTLHIAASLATKYGSRDEPLDIDAYKKRRDEFSTAHVNANNVKIFLDGVPTASRTAAMLAPYVAHPAFADGWRGEMHLTEEILTTDVTALDREGFKVKIHTAGDGSVRRALDAIEAARNANGKGGEQHELAHAGYVDGADIPRFAALNAAPDFSPYIWNPSPIIDSVVQAVGPRGREYWPTRALIDAGANIIVGSDWPSAVETPSPWPGLESLVTRQAPQGDFPGVLWSEQAVTLEEAIALFTETSATALGFENVTGRIEKGAAADIIVLSQNLFEVAPSQISETEVLLTIFEGRPVHAAGPYEELVE